MIKIVLSIYGFDGWGGGLDLFANITRSLASSKNPHFSSTLIIPRRDVRYYISFYYHPIRRALYNLFCFGRWHYSSSTRIPPEVLLSMFSDLSPPLTIRQLGSHFTSIEKYCISNSINILFPCFSPPSQGFTIPWIGYLYDCQHKFLPEYFTSNEIIKRDQTFLDMLNKADNIVVNSKSARNDLLSFYSPFPANIHSLPFAPVAPISFITDCRDLRQAYNLPLDKQYFIVCNQFWKHKNHLNLFKAFAIVLNYYKRDVVLVCTGTKSDFRFPDYFNSLIRLCENLKILNSINFLGRIPKLDQISLMKTSIAVVQPTLFEGGPGGGSAYDAISLGIPLLVSNIDVNLELKSSSPLFYFDPYDVEHIAHCMHQFLDIDFPPVESNSSLIAKSDSNKLKLSTFLNTLFLNIASHASY